MILAEDQKEEFEKVIEPAIKWLNDNCHPHVKIIVTTTDAEIVEGVSMHITHEFVKD